MATVEERLAALEAKVFQGVSNAEVATKFVVNTGAYDLATRTNPFAPEGAVRLPYVEAVLASGLAAELDAEGISYPKYAFVGEVMDDLGLSEQAIQNIAGNTGPNASMSNLYIGGHGMARELVRKVYRVRGGDGSVAERVWWDRSETVLPDTIACESFTALDAGYEIENKLRASLERTRATRK